MNRIWAAKDPVLCDAFVCDCLGIPVDEVSYIRMAERLGTGCADTSKAHLVFLNESTDTEYAEVTGRRNSSPLPRRVQKLAGYTAPKDSCSACYGSLIHALNRLNEGGKLRPGLPPVCIGQAIRDRPEKLEVGTCTSCFSKSLKGCPPKAIDIRNLSGRKLDSKTKELKEAPFALPAGKGILRFLPFLKRAAGQMPW